MAAAKGMAAAEGMAYTAPWSGGGRLFRNGEESIERKLGFFLRWSDMLNHCATCVDVFHFQAEFQRQHLTMAR